MKKIIFVFAFLLVAQLGSAQNTFKQDIIKYFEISGANKAYDKMEEQMSKNIPAEKQAGFKKDIEAAIVVLKDKMADYYMKNLTQEEVKAIIKFYESPAGKKMVAAAASPELMKIAEDWGAGLSETLMKYMQ